MNAMVGLERPWRDAVDGGMRAEVAHRERRGKVNARWCLLLLGGGCGTNDGTTPWMLGLLVCVEATGWGLRQLDVGATAAWW